MMKPRYPMEFPSTSLWLMRFVTGIPFRIGLRLFAFRSSCSSDFGLGVWFSFSSATFCVLCSRIQMQKHMEANGAQYDHMSFVEGVDDGFPSLYQYSECPHMINFLSCAGLTFVALQPSVRIFQTLL